jgi:hypothetical protein
MGNIIMLEVHMSCETALDKLCSSPGQSGRFRKMNMSCLCHNFFFNTFEHLLHISITYTSHCNNTVSKNDATPCLSLRETNRIIIHHCLH